MKLSLALPCMFTETLKTFSTLRNKKQTNKQDSNLLIATQVLTHN